MAPQAGVNGVLPASVLQKNAPASAPRGPKAAQPRLKLVLRRLPPGLTKTEFETALGEDWKLGAGKIDWLNYQMGKVSKDLAKPSRPSRAYMHVTAQAYVQVLGDHVRQVQFTDAAKSGQDSALIGPPTLEFAPYPKIPGGRRRHDNRQGTIDQDQEFKDFLESLTNPIVKPPAPEGEGQKQEKAKTTPLIEALREKKANKDKAQSKATRRGREEPKEEAADKTDKKATSKTGKEASTPGDKKGRQNKAEKAAKEAVKVLNKEAASKDAPASASTEKATAATPSPAPERKRGNVNIAKSMLQRDLGLVPATNRRRGAKRELTPVNATDAAVPSPDPSAAGKAKPKDAPAPALAEAEKALPAPPKKPSRAERRAGKSNLADKTNTKAAGADAAAQSKVTSNPAPTILKKPQAAPAPTPPKGPAASRAPTEPAANRASAPQQQVTQLKAETTTPTRLQGSTAVPLPAGRQAFLKHANPSQGITEPLIEEALKAFGGVEKVEIDKRKGFAYVDFADAETLQKAIAGSPVKIAQGAVQVLERKEKGARNRPGPGPGAPPAAHGPYGPPTGPARGGRGGFAARGGRGRGGPRGGGHAMPNPPAGESAAAAPTPAPAPAPTGVAT